MNQTTRDLQILAAHGLTGTDATTAYRSYCIRLSNGLTVSEISSWPIGTILDYFGSDAARVASILAGDCSLRLAAAAGLVGGGIFEPTEDNLSSVEARASEPVDHRAAAEDWLAKAEAERTAGHSAALSAQIATAHALLADRTPATLVIEHADTIVTNADTDQTMRIATAIATELHKAGL